MEAQEQARDSLRSSFVVSFSLKRKGLDAIETNKGTYQY